ncbi:MAG: DUF1015 domain-containing protein [bacterium]
MSVICPFRGLRPEPQWAAQVASLPYDVLSSEEARELVRGNPNSFLRVNKPEVDFPGDISAYNQEVYQRGRENLQRLIDDGIMCHDDQPCLYLYRLTMNGHSQTGLVALASVAEYEEGRIKKHEQTRPEKVSDRADHIQHLRAQVGPVLSIFHNRPAIRAAFDTVTSERPIYDFVSEDSVRHQMWVVSSKTTIDRLVDNFAELTEIYIADGHHRSAAAAEVTRRMRATNPDHSGREPYNFFLNVIFPHDELQILPYNRVVANLNDLTPAQLIERVGGNFTVEAVAEAVIPGVSGSFGLYCDGRWYKLLTREGIVDNNDPTGSIDAAVLSRCLLTPILGIKDIRTDPNINFVGGIRGVKELVRLVDSGRYAAAFSLYPVSVEQLLKVADVGEVMPPKSTWFEPKLRSGMVVNLLDE